MFRDVADRGRLSGILDDVTVRTSFVLEAIWGTIGFTLFFSTLAGVTCCAEFGTRDPVDELLLIDGVLRLDVRCGGTRLDLRVVGFVDPKEDLARTPSLSALVQVGVAGISSTSNRLSVLTGIGVLLVPLKAEAGFALDDATG